MPYGNFIVLACGNINIESEQLVIGDINISVAAIARYIGFYGDTGRAFRLDKTTEIHFTDPLVSELLKTVYVFGCYFQSANGYSCLQVTLSRRMPAACQKRN